MPTDTPHATWIEHPEALQEWLAALPPEAAVGVDTEFMRTHTFYPQLALLQLGYGTRQALVDPLACNLDGVLRSTLGGAGMLTVMHSASEDLEALAPALPSGPGTLFDTQLAAALVGMGLGVSYRALVHALAGIELDKGETRSNWLQRPLSPAQRSYATLDVVYLDTLHEQLAARLEHRGRSGWHAEECARLKQRGSSQDPDPQPQRTMRAAADWPVPKQALLRRLLLWRDAAARQLDVPRPWLLADALVLDLAHEPPATSTALEQRSRGQRALRSAQRKTLLELLGCPLDAAEIEATWPIVGHAQGANKAALNAMKQYVDTVAAQLDLPSGLLCPRKVLEEFAVTATWPAFLDGWRRDLLHARLTALLPDNATPAASAP
jgi:ribonuclease D